MAAGAAAPVQAPSPSPAPAGSNPWEQRGARGRIAAFGETLQESLFRPAAFFRGTAPAGGVGAALAYAAVVGTLSIGVAVLWQRALGDRIATQWGEGTWTCSTTARRWRDSRCSCRSGSPCSRSSRRRFCTSALAVLGGARGGYGATLKAVCYSWSALAFNIFPFCGAAVGAVWQAVLQVIGMRELHRTSTARAFWAWFLPFIVAFCLAGVLVGAALLGLARFWQQFVGGQFEV